MDNPGTYHNRILLRRLNPSHIPGLLRKRLDVAPGRWAVARYGDRVTAIASGTATVGGLFRSAPRDLVLIEHDEFTLHPVITGLMSGDDHLVEADFLLQARVADPRAFYRLLGDDRDALTVGDLEGWVAAEVRRLVSRVARQYMVHDLCHTTTVAQQVAGELYAFLQTYMAPLGLEVVGIRHVTFLRGEDAVKRADAMRRLREQLRDTTLRERLKTIRDVGEFWDAVDQILHEYRIRALFREDELESLRGEILADAPDLPEEGRESAVTRAVGERDDALRRQTPARWEALLTRLGLEKEDGCDEPSPIDRLERWVTVLRALGTIIFFGTTLIAVLMPGVFEDPQTPQLITAAVGVTLGVLAFISALWLKRRAYRQRQASVAASRRDAMTPERRRLVEQGVRRRLAATLQQVESNLQEAWTRAYRSARQDLAKPLRDLARRTGRLIEDLRGVSYPASPLLTSKDIEPAMLQPWLDLDENLLVQAEELGDVSQQIYEGVITGRWEEVDAAIARVDISLQNIHGQLVKRNTLLKGV